LRVLVACEFSGIVRDAFRARGHYAISCDIIDSEPPSEHHRIVDAREAIHWGWDLIIAHPPCTYLSYAGNRHWNAPGRKEKREQALAFFLELYNAPVEKVCVENPVGYPNTVFRKPDQIIQPYYFGEPYQKRTCLWLKGLPKLEYADTIIDKPEPIYYRKEGKAKGKAITWTEAMKGVGDRSKARSKSFEGIAKAMAEQWGNNALPKQLLLLK
jgi:hypothetical protein